MVKMCGLYCPFGIHYICGMTLTCNDASHMHRNIAFHGCECMVEIKYLIWWLISGLSTVGRSPTVSWLHDMKKLVSGNNKKG